MVQIARKNPEKSGFLRGGFETTAPSNALSVVHTQKLGFKNFSLWISTFWFPPAMEAILDDEFSIILMRFSGAGHVCTIMGTENIFLWQKNIKSRLWFLDLNSADLLQAIYHAMLQLEKSEHIK